MDAATSYHQHESEHRSRELSVPNRLNFGLACAVIVAGGALVWLGSHVQAWLAVLAVGVVFSYVMLTNYALLHEATHSHLNENPTWNYCLGVATGIFFPAPFTMIWVTHQGHHDRNRSDDEMFDLYYASDNLVMKYWIWYATLAGWFWPLVPLGAVLVAILPRPIYAFLSRKLPCGNPSLVGLSSKLLWRIRFELLLFVGVFAGLFWLLDLRVLNTLVLYACFSFNWSTRQYVGHAFSERDVIDGAWNLDHNPVMTAILLNGNYDLNHHRYPEAPWIHLPRLSPANEQRMNYVWQYLRQWRGPQLTIEPNPLSDTPQQTHKASS
ncbi:MAG: fatty acid desaturase [Planctomycetales bacterium]|nr:fatty acid desaturase [Planctomycetales bacterium]